MQRKPDNPSVSIVVPNYNYARFLPDALDSALSQDGPDCEVVVVDDRSSDGSKDVIDAYRENVVSCFHIRNGGHAAAFNTGLAAAKGDVVLFLDADDYLYPDAARTVVDAFDADTAQVQFRLDMVDEERHSMDVYPAPEVPLDDGDVVPKLLESGRYRTTVTSGLAFRREALESVFPIPEEDFRQGADGYLATVVPFHGAVKSIDRCLGAYRQHGANHSSFHDRLGERARWRVEHDFRRFEALSREASERGLRMRREVGLGDPLHVEERLASLCVDRAQHPVPGERRLRLARAGAAASMRTGGSFRRRAMTAGWFLSVGLLPPRMARSVLSWKLDAASRPRMLASASKAIRRLMG